MKKTSEAGGKYDDQIDAALHEICMSNRIPRSFAPPPHDPEAVNQIARDLIKANPLRYFTVKSVWDDRLGFVLNVTGNHDLLGTDVAATLNRKPA